MNTQNQYPIQQDQDLSPSESTVRWYRNIAPNTAIESIPVPEHVDAVTLSILDMLDRQIPDTAADRLRALFSLTTDRGLETMSSKLALEGERVLPVADLLLELIERKDTKLPIRVRGGLLDMIRSTLLGVREGTHNDPKIRLAANAKLSNANILSLDMERAHSQVMSETEYSDRFIKIVRQEAKWFSEHTVGARSGDLFENYVTCLMRQMVWDQEIDTTHSVRHATTREDQPNPKKDGGSGHGYAHDIHTTTPLGVGMIQCKYGLGAHEARDYDPSVTKIIETGEEDLTSSDDFKQAFLAIARGSSQEDIEYIARMIKKYDLENALQPRKLTRAAAATTLLATM